MKHHRSGTLETIFSFDSPIPSIKKQIKQTNFISKLISLKIQANVMYAQNLQAILNKPELQMITHPQSYSQQLFNILLQNMRLQLTQRQQYIEKMRQQVFPQVQWIQRLNLELQLKKDAIFKDIVKVQKLSKQVQQLKNDYMKNYFEANKMQEQFIISSIQFKGFEKKNNLCHRTQNFINQKLMPLKISYQAKASFLKSQISQLEKFIKMVNQKFSEDFLKFQLKAKKIILSDLEYQNVLHSNSIKNIQQKVLKGSQIFQSSHSQLKIDENNITFKIPEAQDYYYLYELFRYASRPQHHKLENLMDFGLSKNPRLSTTSSVISDSTVQEMINTSSITQYQIETLKILENNFIEIFLKQGDKQQHISQLIKLTQNLPKLRKLVNLCLQKFRQNQQLQMNPKCMPNIINYLNQFLTQCMHESDIYNSKLILLHTSSYYTQIENKVVYLSDSLKRHKIWSDCSQWWTCSFLQNCYESLLAKPTFLEHQEDLINIWLIKGIGGNQQIGTNPKMRIFSFLDSFTLRMKQMNISELIIEEMVNKYVKVFQLEKLVNTSNGQIKNYLVINDLKRSNMNFFKKIFH